tara:strand:- start:1610 stop:2005 length:396 start_codon:yes stop_codon:yes gene_type:complete
MEFCDNCDNKMNIKWKNDIVDSKKEKLLVYHCITCGNIKEYNKNTIINPKLYHQNYQIDKSYVTFNNELLCSDPTLQKVTDKDIKCPNTTCPSYTSSNSNAQQDIIYYIYDTDNMKYLYICCHCKSSWKTQ